MSSLISALHLQIQGFLAQRIAEGTCKTGALPPNAQELACVSFSPGTMGKATDKLEAIVPSITDRLAEVSDSIAECERQMRQQQLRLIRSSPNTGQAAILSQVDAAILRRLKPTKDAIYRLIAVGPATFDRTRPTTMKIAPR